MPVQRLPRILAFAAVVFGIAELYLWRQTGSAGPVWLRQATAFAAVGALVLALILRDTRPRLVLRFLAALFALIAVLAFAADWTDRAANPDAHAHAKTLLDHLLAFTPKLVAAIKSQAVGAFGPDAWDPVLTTALGVPTSLAFACLAAIAGYAGRPRRTTRIFVN